MLQKRICSDRNYPWLVAQEEEEEEEEEDDKGELIFYNVYDSGSYYRCRIPELVGRRIEGCYHGWVILSNDLEWFLWNPDISKLITLPPLILKDGDFDDILNCYLTSPPNVPGSILLLTRDDKPNFVFCRLDQRKRKRKWTEMSYGKQLISITGEDDDILFNLTCCNGKVYASTSTSYRVIEVNIVVKNKEVVISLLAFVDLPSCPYQYGPTIRPYTFLIGSCQQLFTILVCVNDEPQKKPVDVYLYKLEMSSLVWAETEDLKDTVIFVDMDELLRVGCLTIASESGGGYVHLLHQMGKIVYSYHVKEKTISLSFMDCLADLPPSLHISLWAMPEAELRLQGDHIQCKAVCELDDDKEDEMVVKATNKIEADMLLNLPFHVLEMMMEFCVGIEYLNFRATCKRCHLAAPLIGWSKLQWQTYSLVSPWLMALDSGSGIMTFTDPMFGDKYFLTETFCHSRIVCSRYGWLLMYVCPRHVAFFNPFTTEIRMLPAMPVFCSETYCFSAPPTSPDCMVVGFARRYVIYLQWVDGEPIWHTLALDFGQSFFGFPIFCGRDVYALLNGKGVIVFREILGGQGYSWEVVVDQVPTSCSSAKYFLAKCDQHLLLVMMGEFGEFVEVFKLTDELEWEKMDGLGRHVIYICGTTSACLCMDAKTPEMENVIYFPRLHSENGKPVFYSLKTRRYHTFDGSRNIDQQTSLKDLFGTKQHVYGTHAWIEPSWAS